MSAWDPVHVSKWLAPPPARAGPGCKSDFIQCENSQKNSQIGQVYRYEKAGVGHLLGLTAGQPLASSSFSPHVSWAWVSPNFLSLS